MVTLRVGHQISTNQTLGIRYATATSSELRVPQECFGTFGSGTAHYGSRHSTRQVAMITSMSRFASKSRCRHRTSKRKGGVVMPPRVFLFDPELQTLFIEGRDAPPIVEQTCTPGAAAPFTKFEIEREFPLLIPGVLLILVVAAALSVPAGPLWIYGVTVAAVAALTGTLRVLVKRHQTTRPPEDGSGQHGVALWREAVQSANSRKTIVDAILVRVLEIVIPLVVIGGVCCAAEIWLSLGVLSDPSARTLLWIEKTSISLRAQYGWISKLPKQYELPFIVALTILVSFLPVLAQLDLLVRWKTTASWLGRAYVLLTILAAITFFGNQHAVGALSAAARLNTQIEKVRDAYGDIQEQTERIVSRLAVNELASSRFNTHISGLRAFDEATERAERQAEAARKQNVPVRLGSARMRESVYRSRPAEGNAAGARATHRDEAGSANWTGKRAANIAAEAGANSRAEKARSSKLHPVVDSAADYVYGEVFKSASKPVFAAAGLDGELLQLLLEPLLKTPGKEYLKRQARALFDRVANHGQSMAEAMTAIRQDIRAELKSIAPESKKRSKWLGASLGCSGKR